MRIAAVVAKDLAELRRNPGVLVAAALTGLLSLLIPFFVAVIVPSLAGERLSDSSDFQVALEMYKTQSAARDLDPEGAIQAWIFQTFLALMLLTPVAGAMSIAAYSVVGEKQGRTLEPLLATPISTLELLIAKVLGALLPALGLAVLYFAVYFVAVAVVARPGVFWILLAPRSLAIVFVLGPLAALAALQLAVCVSSRVNDPRTAQQAGVFIILPIGGLLIGQVLGALLLTPQIIGLIALALVALNAALMWLSITLFDRESILTRWK
jgi:ABC-2 type transport system permease protein